MADDSGAIIGITVQDGVHLLVEEALEVVAELGTESLLDSLENVGEDAEVGGVVLVVVAALEDTGANKAGVPAVHVSTDDVGGRVVTDHVDVLGEALLAVELAHPRGQDVIGVLVGSQLRLAVDDTLEVGAGKGLVHSLKADAESTLRHAGVGVLGRAEEIALGEVDGDSVGDGVLSDRAQATVLSAEDIHNDLHVGGIVSRVREDHDGLNADLGEVTGTRSGTLLISEDAVGSNGRVPGDNVVGDDDVAEAVLLGDLTAAVTLTTDNEDGAVVLRQSTHGGVRLNELVGADRVAEDLLELLATILLNLTGTVGKENVRDLDAELVVSVEDLEGLLTLGDQTVTVNEDTVNVKGKGHVLGLGDLLSLEVLDLGDEEVPGRLDRGHAGPGGAAVGMVNGGETGLTLAGDGQSGTEGVSGRSSVPHGRRHAEVVHVLGRL
ncbi:hypothetical protein HG530_015556 [Fusarium avenaceum]|nr:hypothetical protein HG530_015556 [Fusarium avenaceum]